MTATHLIRDNRGKAATWLLLALLVAGAAFAIWYFVLRDAGSASASRLARLVLPARSEYIGAVDLNRILTSADTRQALTDLGADLSQLDQVLAKAGIAAADIGGLAFGSVKEADGSNSVVVALEAKTDAQAVGALFKVVASQLPANLIGQFDPNDVKTFAGPDGRGIFLVGSGPLLAEASALAGGGPAPTRKAELALLEQAVTDRAILWAAGPIPSDALGGIGGSMFTSTLGGAPSHFGLGVAYGGKLTLTGAAHIPGGDASQAAGALKSMQRMFGSQAPAAVRPLLDTLAFGGTGPVLTVSLQVDPKTLAGLQKNL